MLNAYRSAGQRIWAGVIVTDTVDETPRETAQRTEGRRGGLLRRLAGDREGVAAIEFAMLAIPFFLLAFAIIEMCVAYAAEQLLDHAVDDMARKLRTGQITFASQGATDMNADEFREAFCAEIAIMMGCNERLYLDVQEFNDFDDMPLGVPREDGAPFGNLEDGEFGFSPGDGNSKNMLRAYYRWPVVTNLIRPFVTNIRPEGEGLPSDYLIIGTAAFQNEAF